MSGGWITLRFAVGCAMFKVHGYDIGRGVGRSSATYLRAARETDRAESSRKRPRLQMVGSQSFLT